ncbi:MAG: alanine racemase [Salaquimonas sp.]
MSPYPPHSNGRLTIDLDAIVSNWKKLAGKSTHKNCAAVVKADAYGLGAERVAAALYKAGCRDFFTATIAEGIYVRKIAPDARIYIFNGFNSAAEKDYRKHRLTPVINSPVGIEYWLSKKRPNMRCALHLDTGINRLGLTADQFADLPKDPARLAMLNPELVISHFACADDPEHPLNARQIEAFTKAVAHFPNARKSLANSAGVFLSRSAHFDLLRPGISLYGGDAVNNVRNPMKPVVRLEGRIIQRKWARKGESVGYGAPEKLKRDTLLAVVAIGYADGLHRAASGAGTLFRNKTHSPGGMGMIGKHKVPILGRISMDIATFDMTDIPERLMAKTEWIDLINKDLRVDELAAAAGTIGYEILTSLGRRYERVYVGG